MKIANTVLVAASICLAVLGMAGVLCAKQPTREVAPHAQPPPSTQAADRGVNAKLVTANNKFSFKLFSQILKQQSNQNIFISPASVAIALAITYNGASGKTQSAMAQTLELQGISLEEVNQANAALKATLKNSDPKVQLAIANSLWAREGVSLKPGFIQKIQGLYGAEVKNLNFDAPTAPNIINNWVKQSTNGKIDKIVERIEPNNAVFLINAIYFLGTWTAPFPKSATKERPFTLLDGTQKQHPMMFQELRKGSYYENEMFQAISLPYGDGRLSMYIFLPRKGVSLKTFYESLNAENWEKWMNQFEKEEVISIGLPRFKLEYDIDLKDALNNLGMQIAFSGNADFSAMIPPPFGISQVKHKTFVVVNEEGTEAAAVTEAGMSRGGPTEMIVDHPFFCAIRDNKTETILFMGSVVEPN